MTNTSSLHCSGVPSLQRTGSDKNVFPCYFTEFYWLPIGGIRVKCRILIDM